MTQAPSDPSLDPAPKGDMQAQGIARVYAKALLQAAEKAGQADTVLEQLQELLIDVCNGEPQFEAFLSSGAVGRDRKAGVIDRVFKGRGNDILVNFLQILNAHERLDMLRPTLGAFRELHNELRKRVRVQVRSAVALSDEERSRLIRQLQTTFQLEPILETSVDADLLGGLVVRVGDWLCDASVRSKLDSIRNQLIERSSYEIQSRRDRFSSANGN